MERPDLSQLALESTAGSMRFYHHRLALSLLFLLLVFPVVALDGSASMELRYADSIRTSNPEEFKRLINKLDTERYQLNQNEQYLLNYLLAFRNLFEGEKEKSIKQFKRLMKSDADVDIKFRACHGVISASASSRDWALGLNYLSLCDKYQRSTQSLLYRTSYLAETAQFYGYLGQYELALGYAGQLSRIVNDERGICIADGLTLQFNSELGIINGIEPAFDNAISQCKDEPIMVNIIRLYQAKALLSNGDINAASELIASTIADVEKIAYPRLTATVYMVAALVNKQLNNKPEVRYYSLKVIELTSGKDALITSQSIADAYRLLWEHAEAEGKVGEALTYHKKYFDAEKQYWEDRQSRLLAFNLAVRKTKEQELKIDFLNERNNSLTLKSELTEAQAENTEMFVALLAAVCLLTSLFAYRSWQTKNRIRRMAEYDVLTSALSRAHFIHLAESALKYFEDTDQTLALILFDLDRFKEVNDLYGHAIGDWVLIKVAEACKQHIRRSDLFARIGGEEFCILLPYNNMKDSLLIAEQCRRAISAIDTSETGFKFDVSASFGVSDTRVSGFKLTKLTADADTAMYESKRNGRNLVSGYTDLVAARNNIIEHR